MSHKTLKETIRAGYHYLDCEEGCWQDGSRKVLPINLMDEQHIKNCIDMAQRAIESSSTISIEHRKDMVNLINIKIDELKNELKNRNKIKNLEASIGELDPPSD